MQSDRKRLHDKPGPLPRKQSKENKGNGKSAEDVSEERRRIAKERERHQASFVWVFKIQRGRQEIHRWKEILEVRGFDTSPSGFPGS